LLTTFPLWPEGTCQQKMKLSLTLFPALILISFPRDGLFTSERALFSGRQDPCSCEGLYVFGSNIFFFTSWSNVFSPVCEFFFGIIGFRLLQTCTYWQKPWIKYQLVLYLINKFIIF
jgi:hypothetical protein